MSTTEAGQLVPADQRLQTVRQMLAANQKGLAALLGKTVAPERFCRMVLTLCQNNPKLLDCDRNSLALSVLRIAQLNLSPDPTLGQAWLIPRKGKADFQLGFRGALALAYRSPLVKAIRYNVVRKGDHFVWTDGRNWTLEHQPSDQGWPETFEDILAAWVVIETVNGGAIPRVMFSAEIARHRNRSQAVQAGGMTPWKTDPAPMALKVVLDDACLRGPFEGEIGRAIALDRRGELGLGQPDDGTLDVADFKIVNGGDGKAGKVDAFKAAHGAAPAEATPAEREPGADEDFLGDALGEDGADLADQEPPHVRKLMKAVADLGLTPDEADSIVGARIADSPAGAEAEIMRKLRDGAKTKRK